MKSAAKDANLSSFPCLDKKQCSPCWIYYCISTRMGVSATLSDFDNYFRNRLTSNYVWLCWSRSRPPPIISPAGRIYNPAAWRSSVQIINFICPHMDRSILIGLPQRNAYGSFHDCRGGMPIGTAVDAFQTWMMFIARGQCTGHHHVYQLEKQRRTKENSWSAPTSFQVPQWTGEYECRHATNLLHGGPRDRFPNEIMYLSCVFNT